MSKQTFNPGTFVSGFCVDPTNLQAKHYYIGVVANHHKPWRIHVSLGSNKGLSDESLVPVVVFAATSGGSVSSPAEEAETPWWNGGLALKCIQRDGEFGCVGVLSESQIGSIIWLSNENSQDYRNLMALTGADHEVMRVVSDRARAMSTIVLYMQGDGKYPQGYEGLAGTLKKYL